MAVWSYTVAVCVDPGSPRDWKKGRHGAYSQLPTQECPTYTSCTVKSSGEIRYCKKCDCKKPDRTHHCSTCGRCVLKMDHHCPWLAACLGLRNHKPFLLFISYTSLFCWLCFARSAWWVWLEIFSNGQFAETMMPVNYIMLAVVSGIIGLVLTAFTAWHIWLTANGLTTIEKLEKTRYFAPVKRAMAHQLSQQNSHSRGRTSLTGQLLEIHANALPGVTRLEEGEETSLSNAEAIETNSPARQTLRNTYEADERRREAERYAAYVDEVDFSRLPNAFDLGWKSNLRHVFGERKLLFLLPICNTTGDGWRWDVNPQWTAMREQIWRDRAQREQSSHVTNSNYKPRANMVSRRASTRSIPELGASGDERYLTTSNGVALVNTVGRRSPRKADRILGRRDGEGGLISDVDERELRGEDPYQIEDDRLEAEPRDPTKAERNGPKKEERRDTDTEDDRRNSIRKSSQQTANWNDIPDDMLSSFGPGTTSRSRNSIR